MKKIKRIVNLFMIFSAPVFATEDVATLQQEMKQLEAQVQSLQKSMINAHKSSQHLKSAQHVEHKVLKHAPKLKKGNFHKSPVLVQVPNHHPEALEFYPTALIADDQVVTYIAGTPVITAPYLGARPAFDGSDYIVNISSINRDLRLMLQRRNLYRSYEQVGSPHPDVPIITLSGKVEPVMSVGRPYFGAITSDLTLGSDELDVTAILNEEVEAYMGIAYDSSPPEVGGQRVSNSGFSLNMGFVNIGNLDKTPFYTTVGQLYVPFGRYSSAMVSPTLPMILARTKSRPIIVGYKSQEPTGPLVSLYGFKSDTTLGTSGIGGVNLAYIFSASKGSGEIGASFISSVNDATGMQYTNSPPATTFGGFASLTNGSESVQKTPAAGVHANVSFDRYSLTAEWVGATERFRTQDLSFDGHGALPQALQAEAGVTFSAFDKPASLAAAYQWSGETLALNMPHQRISGVFNISVWKDTLESLEYRHDIDFKTTQYANGANAPGFAPNQNTYGSGKTADMIVAQIGVFF